MSDATLDELIETVSAVKELKAAFLEQQSLLGDVSRVLISIDARIKALERGRKLE